VVSDLEYLALTTSEAYAVVGLEAAVTVSHRDVYLID
jgi:hypothetical protein